MYGSNANVVGEFGSSDSSFGAEGVAAGAVSNSEKDRRLDGLNIAIKNSHNIGLKSGDSSKPLTIDKGEDILTFLRGEEIQEKLSKNYDEIKSDIEERIKHNEAAERTNYLNDLFDPSIPPPSADFMTDEELLEILDEDNYEGSLKLPTGEFISEKDKIFTSLLHIFGRKFNEYGVIKEPFKGFINTNVTRFGKTSNANIPLLVPLELELDIDGIGGIYPGNSFHSTYVPVRYQEHTVFQAKDVNHRLDSSGWTTTLRGMMRTTLETVFESNTEYKDIKEEYIKNYEGKAKQRLEAEKKERQGKAGVPPITTTIGLQLRISNFLTRTFGSD